MLLVLVYAEPLAPKLVMAVRALVLALVRDVQALVMNSAQIIVLQLVEVLVQADAKTLVQKHVLIIAKEVAINLTVWVVVVVDAEADAEELVVVHATVQRSNLCK